MSSSCGVQDNGTAAQRPSCPFLRLAGSLEPAGAGQRREQGARNLMDQLEPLRGNTKRVRSSRGKNIYIRAVVMP